MTYGTPSGKCRTSSFVLCIVIITGYLGGYIVTDALVFPQLLNIFVASCSNGVSTSGARFDSLKLLKYLNLGRNSATISTSLGSLSLSQLARKKASTLLTPLFCVKVDSIFDDSESLSEEVQSALDMALGEVIFLCRVC